MSDMSVLLRQPTLQPQHQIDGPQSKGVDKGSPLQTPLQRQMIARSGLTPLPKPEVLSAPKEGLVQSASQKARSEQTNNVCPSRKEVAEKRIDKASEKAKEARSMGVDVAKNSFWKKALSAACSVVAVAIFAGLTAVSFGGAAPLLAVASVAMANSIGDAVCAYRNFKNIEAEANHKEPPYAKLPCGNSFMGNVGFKLGSALGMGEDNAKIFGKVLGVAVGGGLGIASIALSAGLGTLPLLPTIVSSVATGVNTAVNFYSALGSAMTSDMDKEHIKQLQQEVRSDVLEANRTHAGTGGEEHVRNVDGAVDLLVKAEGNAERRREWAVGIVGILGPLAGPGMDLVLGGHRTPPPTPPPTGVPEGAVAV
jgi:secreted effector protein SseF